MKTKEGLHLLDRETYYSVFKAHDARFDGQVFMGVSSTGIYCRPICRVKFPKKENCSFFHSAAMAEAKGYRPCLKCRPELAPGMSIADSSSNLVLQGMLRLEEKYFYEGNLQEIARDLNITDRHFRRIFYSTYGVTPSQYLQTLRLLMAKRLLTDTKLSITEVAFGSGFGSIRRFNGLFLKTYRMAPTIFRKEAKKLHPEQKDTLTLFLDYRPPYEWEALLEFLQERAIPGVEVIKDKTYYRTVILKKKDEKIRGWLGVRRVEKKNRLAVTVSAELLPVLFKVLKRIKILFDLECNPQEINVRLKKMNQGKEKRFIEGTRLPGSFDPFEMSVRAVLGQQITIKGARTLAQRLTERLGTQMITPIPELTHTFPEPEELLELGSFLEEILGVLGIIRSRTRSIRSLAFKFSENDFVWRRGLNMEQWVYDLEALPGVGPWTAQYIIMRAFGYPDAFLPTDYGIRKALPGYSSKEIAEIAESWRPWRSYGVIALWNSLKMKSEVSDQ